MVVLLTRLRDGFAHRPDAGANRSFVTTDLTGGA
jgi:hypothetical protein